MNLPPRRCGALLALLLLAASPCPAQDRPAPPPKRVVVLGIDGADAAIFERLMKEGRLPRFAALAKKGCYGRLATTNPAQSPVSWAAAATSTNSGKNGIYDFIRRDPDVPGRLDLALGSRNEVDGPLGPGGRVGFPALAALAAGLVAWGLVALCLRLFRRKSSAAPAVVAGLLAAGGAAAWTHRVLSWVPERIPKASSNRLGVPFWSVLGEAGVDSIAVEAPVSFPADRARNLRLLTGLGTPDVQAFWGFYSVFTEDPKEVVEPETGGFVDALVFDASGTALSRVYGPPDITLSAEEKAALEREEALARAVWEQKIGVPTSKRFEERVWQHARRASQASCVLEVRRDAAARTATIRVGSGGPRPVLDLPLPRTGPGSAAALPGPGDPAVRWGEPLVLKERAWSPYVEFSFEMNPLVRVKGIGRFWLESAGADGKPFRLALAPVSFDPRDVPSIVEVSWPASFAPSLASKAGVYNLVGWPCLTNPVKDGMLSDEAFIAHARDLLAERRRKLKAAMEQPGWRFLFVMFSEVDRVQHAFWRHVDPKSPTHDPAAAKVYGPCIDEMYVAMDEVLGDITAAAGEDAAVIVMSDHGFAPYRRGVHLNNFLQDAGFQSGGFGDSRSVNQLASRRNFLSGLAWDTTQAYAAGLGGIYVNLKGREAKGSVDPKDYDAVCARIRTALLALRDADGSKVVREVYLGKDLYSGPTAARFAPDLVVGFESGYRVSWQTTLGGGGDRVIQDNPFRWSGDHCSVDPSLVPGILVSGVPLRLEGAGVMDVAPTVLDLFGVPRPAGWDGKSLVPR
jgi:predicted AlkP superfamily phosphohydrolase/phosphomutase